MRERTSGGRFRPHAALAHDASDEGGLPTGSRDRKPTHKPGHRVKALTFIEFQKGGWVVECDCGERLYLNHATIYTRGHCGCRSTTSHSEGEATWEEIGDALGRSKQRAEQISASAEINFAANWALWRLVMDTDVDTADRPTLWKVVQACRILSAALDARSPQA